MSKYAENKPKECTLCRFYDKKNNKCGLDACYYLVEAPEKKESHCDGCPYGKHHEICFPAGRNSWDREGFSDGSKS